MTLSYNEDNSNDAEACEISETVNVSVISPCGCVAGICRVTIQGNTGSIGVASLKYRVGKENDYSSWVTISYSLNCPPGYIHVPANASVNANNDFCVMETEAKNVAGLAVTSGTGLPWNFITSVAASTACEDLNTLNSVTNKYNLLSNEEWMAIARNIEQNPTNWSNGSISLANEINRGHSDVNPNTPLSISNFNDPYNQTLNSDLDLPSIGWEQKRTHTLSNNNIIWDFAGNVGEIVDLSLNAGLQLAPSNKKPYSNTDGAPLFGYKELNEINALIGENVSDLFFPNFWQPLDPNYSHAQGVGQYYGGDNTSGGLLVRGGAFNEGNRAGIYNFELDSDNTSSFNWLGFRCVYRP